MLGHIGEAGGRDAGRSSVGAVHVICIHLFNYPHLIQHFQEHLFTVFIVSFALISKLIVACLVCFSHLWENACRQESARGKERRDTSSDAPCKYFMGVFVCFFLSFASLLTPPSILAKQCWFFFLLIEFWEVTFLGEWFYFPLFTVSFMK